MLALRGQVFPATLEPVTLGADVLIGEGQTAVSQRIVGESAIPKAGGKIQRVHLEPTHVRAYPPALRAIFQADLIVMGPGSLYTSILPNLLIEDLAQAIKLARAPTVYICNLATQPGETDGYDVAEHVQAIQTHISDSCIDIVLANDNINLDPAIGGGKTNFVQPTQPNHTRLVTADLADESRPWRHDSQKVAKAIISLLAR